MARRDQKTGAAVGLMLLALAACGPSEKKRGDAPAKCRELLKVFCVRAVDCGAVDGTVDECREWTEEGAACDEATGTGPGYPMCLDNLNTFACGALFPGGDELPLPVSCQGVLETEE